MNLYKLKKSIKLNEGLRLNVYKLNTPNVHESFYTIGYGHKLRHKIAPITEEKAELFLEQDINIAISKACRYFNKFASYPWNIQNFLVEMCFNMGYNIVSFKKANKALRKGDLETAIKEYRDSLWAKQVGKDRVDRLMNLLRGA